MEKNFIYIVAVIFLILGIVDLGRSLILKNKTGYVVGEVILIWQPNPEAVKKGNSKWATFSYIINGKNYTSQNRLQVSMNTKVGDRKIIKYDKKTPEKLYSFSVKRALVFFAVSALFFLVGKLNLQ